MLKCLEKEPGRRYPSGEALGDDLDRWLRGEPIQARPVGRVTRGWLWCKRNPVIASLMAAVAASMVVASVLSTSFGIWATNNARRADRLANAERIESLRANEAAQGRQRKRME